MPLYQKEGGFLIILHGDKADKAVVRGWMSLTLWKNTELYSCVVYYATVPRGP